MSTLDAGAMRSLSFVLQFASYQEMRATLDQLAAVIMLPRRILALKMLLPMAAGARAVGKAGRRGDPIMGTCFEVGPLSPMKPTLLRAR